MNAFTINGSVHGFDAGFIVTPLDHLWAAYKIEMITNCLNPVVLHRIKRKWLIKQPGCIPFTPADIKKLGSQIDRYQRYGYER